MDAEWLKIADVAELMEVTESTITAWIRKYNFPAHKVGGKLYFDINEINDWIKSRRGRNNG